MRALSRPPNIHLLSCSQQIRTLTTRPSRIPTFVRTWDPAAHTKPREHELPPEQVTQLPVPTYDAFRSRRHVDSEEAGLTPDPVLGRKYAVGRVNECLWLINNGRYEASWLRTKLWRAYSLAKIHDPDLLKRLPHRAWDLLWTSHSIMYMRNWYCRVHVQELYRDMLWAGKPATVQQQVSYFESIFFNRNEKLALREWEEVCGQSLLGENLPVEPELLESGTRMHALAGNVDRARELMDTLFDSNPTWDPAIMTAVFRAHTRSQIEEHHEMARKIYIKFKELLGDNATLEDYDGFLAGFLEAEQLQYAKEVFRDMVLGRRLAHEYSIEHVHEVLRRLHLLYRLGTDIAKATGIALSAISTLQQPYHSHLFGDWMKLAVVQRAPEAAAQILDMMFKRGCEPETFHFNLLLKVLFRTTEKPHELKAENIGWHMIAQSAKSLPQKTRPVADAIIEKQDDRALEPELIQPGVAQHQDNPALTRRVPSADVSTFAVLMQHHANHSQWEHVDYLTRRMKELELRPNQDLMNVLMDNQCRQGNYNEVWEIYTSLTDVPEGTAGVFSNGTTFRCLWRTLRLALGSPKTRENSTFPSPRRLLAENIRWWDLVRNRFDVEQFRIGLAALDHGALNALIMHSFSYTKDLAGSLVAMHALRHRFDIFPSNRASQILQKHIAWVDMHHDTESARAKYSRSGVFDKTVAEMGQVYHILLDARLKRKGISDEQYDYMSKEEIGDLALDSLSEFIRAVMKRQHPPEVVEAMIAEAKNEIGLPDLPTGDMDAFAVA